MSYTIIIFSQLVVLFFLSKKLTATIFKIFYELTGNQKWAVYLLAIIFAPGILIHELSHFLAALFLLVPVSNLEIIPEIHDDGVKMGSVSIGKTDPVRRFLIGVAPFVLGTGLILGGTYFAVQYPLILKPFYLLPFTYLLFATANTMFASKKDLEGAYKLFIFILIIYTLTILLGINFPFLSFEIFSNESVLYVLRQSSLFLLFPLSVNLVLLFSFKLAKI